MEVENLLLRIWPSVGDQAKPGLGYPPLACQFGRDGEQSAGNDSVIVGDIQSAWNVLVRDDHEVHRTEVVRRLRRHVDRKDEIVFVELRYGRVIVPAPCKGCSVRPSVSSTRAGGPPSRGSTDPLVMRNSGPLSWER
jgi:hypothetical protein